MMKHFLLILSFATVFALPAFANERFVIDFNEGKPVFRDEPIDLIELIERRAPRYINQDISGVIVEAEPRNGRHRGYVQLLDDYRRVIDESPLSRGYASLRVYDHNAKPGFLLFDTDVYLNRIEIVSEEPPYLKPLKQKEIKVRRPDIQIGDFVKTSYSAERKNFPIPHGGYSRINFKVQIREQYGVIVNMIFVIANGKQVTEKTVGRRLSNGDNIFPLDVPEEATDIQVSFDHGQGSAVQVFLLR